MADIVPARILLATYDGARYLPDQLDSFLRQTHEWTLAVSDDGSTDGTLDILEAFRTAHPDRVHALERRAARPELRGASGNFAHLLAVHGDAPYLALADQDDVWDMARLERGVAAVRALEGSEGAGTPILVHSDLALIDREGNALHRSMHEAQHLQPRSRKSLRHLLPQNSVTGCSVTMNQALRDLALPIPAEAVMHDWWLALVAAAFGSIEVIDAPLVNYRQHGGNALGAKPYTPARMLLHARQLGDMRKRIHRTYVQAAAFLERYDARLKPADRELVAAYAALPSMNAFDRRKTLLRYRFAKAGVARTLGMYVVA